MIDWGDVIKLNRPKVSPSTVRTYKSTLNGLLKHLNQTDPAVDYFDKHPSQVLDHLKSFSPGKRKNILSAVVAVSKDSGALEAYRTQMMTDIESYNKKQENQLKTESQRANWLSYDQIRNVYENLEKDTKHLWKKEKLTAVDLKQLMGYVALSCYLLIPPRRLLDYSLFKLKHVDKEKDNYLDKRSFVFNTYKTAKTYGTQRVKIPVKLHSIITRWSKKIGDTSEYLLFNSKGEAMSQPQMTVFLQRLFGKKVSVNMIRHAFITDRVLDNTPALKELQDTASAMANSVSVQQLYRKLD